jgi:hypothetical protein
MHCLLEPWFEILHLQVAVDDLKVLFGFVVEVFLQLLALVPVMEELHGLFEADGDDEAENDGGNVDEELAPSGGGVVWRVNVEPLLIRGLRRLRLRRVRVERLGGIEFRYALLPQSGDIFVVDHDGNPLAAGASQLVLPDPPAGDTGARRL